MTSDGSSNSANAESNLTFDGTKLSLAGYMMTSSAYFSGQTATFDVFTVADTVGIGATFEYYVVNTASSRYRYGQIMAVWNSTNDTVEFTDTSTQDLGGSTAALTFSVAILSNVLTLTANIASGTWTIKIGARIL